MTTPPDPDVWDLDRIKQIIVQNKLERGRIEYKRQVDDGRKILEAITAFANTFGGVVLVHIDEDKEGLDRLTGVPSVERTRLVSWCWSRLTPPCNPEIVPIELGHDDLYVFVVVVNIDYIRRPVMINKGNKILVRLDDQNQEPDWYRLRDLFAENSVAADPIGRTGRSIIQQEPHDLSGDFPVAFGIRGELWLVGPRGQESYVTEAGRRAVLDVLNRGDCPLTSRGRALAALVDGWAYNDWHPSGWVLDGGRQSIKRICARWKATTPDGRRRMIEVRIAADLQRSTGRQVSLDIEIDVLFPELGADPYLDLGTLGRIIMDMTGTLWGSAGEALSHSLLGQPLGPPAGLAVSLGCLGDVRHRIDEFIHFGSATLIPGNRAGEGQEFDTITPDRGFLSATSQMAAIREWLIQLGINNGYRDVETEVASRLGN